MVKTHLRLRLKLGFLDKDIEIFKLTYRRNTQGYSTTIRAVPKRPVEKIETGLPNL